MILRKYLLCGHKIYAFVWDIFMWFVWKESTKWRHYRNWIFICLCIVNRITNYNQQDATFLDLFIYTDALHVSGGSSAHHQEHITVHAASGIVNEYCSLLLSWMRRSSISSTTAASSSIGWQYLKLYVQLCAPDDGRRNRLKHVERL